MIDFTAEPFFANGEERAQAVGRLRRIVGYFEPLEKPFARYGDGYNRPALVRLTFDYARSQDSKDRFLVAFFQSLAIGMLNDDKIDLTDDDTVAGLREAVFGFAEFLMTNFFLPRMPISQPAERSGFLLTRHSASEYQQDTAAVSHLPRCYTASPDTQRTPERLSTLRGDCLVRDRHRCVIMRTFDFREARDRLTRPPATDDDGNPIDVNTGTLEVAHILPFALTKAVNGRLVGALPPFPVRCY